MLATSEPSGLSRPTDISSLRSEFLRVKEQQKLRNRDAAQAIGLSEGEALAVFIGEHVVRLKNDFPALFEEVPQLGPVMALTRNGAAVHEKDGQYENMSHSGPVGLALGPAIDLRIFYRHWAFGYAVIETTPRGPQKSLQFYDAHGNAVHKIFLREHSWHDQFDNFVARWRADDQAPGEIVTPVPPLSEERPDSAIDVDGFQAAWRGMTDTHQFFGVLQRFGVTRTQALRLAPDGLAVQVAATAVRQLFEDAAATGLPIMVFVGNTGMIQIHTGPVRNIKIMGPWLNVLDPDFNLHLREDLIASAWIVEKPTDDGIVTSLEIFDREGMTIAMLFGARKPGKPELPAWRDAVARLRPLTTGAGEA